MAKHFYSHLIDPEDIRHELEVLDLADDESNHLLLIIESTMHHVVVDALLEEMHGDHKDVFLGHIATDNHEGAWDVLNKHVEKPEQKIVQAIKDLKDELVLDIEKAKEDAR